MPAAPRRSPLEGTDRVIVDGTNLLWRLGARSGGPAPASAIVARLRAAIPVAVSIDLVFDGMGQGVFGRLAQNMLVRYSGKRSADDTILDLVAEAAMHGVGGAAAADRVLVVSGDRPLRDRVMAKGGRTAPLEWLTARLDVPVPAPGPAADRTPAKGSAIGAGMPKGNSPSRDEGTDRPGWKPGRGATAKAGPAHKVARHKRHPRTP
jgi:hypothetical protein